MARAHRRHADAAAQPRTGLVTFSTLLAICVSLVISPANAEKILRRGNLAEPYSLDPHHTTGLNEANILGEILMGLYTENANGEPILGAAESAETSTDGLRWTFKIRDHKWSDGLPVTSDDFLFTFQRIMTPATAAEYVNVLYPIKNAEAVSTGKLPVDKLAVSAPDAKTLVIELGHPAPYLPQLLMHQTTYPIQRRLVAKYPTGWTKPGIMPANGPYLLAEWRPNDHLKLVKNPNFYDAATVKIDTVYFYPIEDDLAALKKYRAGELDTQDRWPIGMHDWLTKNIPNEARRSTALWAQYTSFNSKRKPFDDVRVRKALAMAIDRKAIANDIFGGSYGAEATNVLAPGIANVDRSAQVEWAGKTMDERRAEAKRLLTAAGYGPDHPLRFTYNFSTNVDNRRIGVAMQRTSAQRSLSTLKNPRFIRNSCKRTSSSRRGSGRQRACRAARASLVKPYVLGWVSNPHRINRTRWLDIADHVGPQESASVPQTGAVASEGGIWSWLGSWFSAAAWSKWWNS